MFPDQRVSAARAGDARKHRPGSRGPAIWLVVSIVWALQACAPAVPSMPSVDGPQRIGVYAVWLNGHEDGDRDQLDAFFDCLLAGSNLNQFWDGEVDFAYRGSFGVTPPQTQLVYSDAGDWLRSAVDRGEITVDSRDDRSAYVVFASGLDVALLTNACGRTAVERIQGRHSAVAFVRNYPLCWPTRDSVRNETQLAMHELVEGVDRLLGDAPCAGDGSCEGFFTCSDPCDTFVGLECEGAPVGSWTGCRGGAVDGWVVQKVARAGRDWANCDTCMHCDFTPRLCAPGEPGCGATPAERQ